VEHLKKNGNKYGTGIIAQTTHTYEKKQAQKKKKTKKHKGTGEMWNML
jgi:hypothetical protein